MHSIVNDKSRRGGMSVDLELIVHREAGVKVIETYGQQLVAFISPHYLGCLVRNSNELAIFGVRVDGAILVPPLEFEKKE